MDMHYAHIVIVCFLYFHHANGKLNRIVTICIVHIFREQSKEADCGIIFTPYNYLLDRKSRKSNNLEVSGNIIIFDEAHNLEQICEESASFDLTSMDIAKCIMETGDLLKATVKLSETGILPEGYEAGEIIHCNAHACRYLYSALDLNFYHTNSLPQFANHLLYRAVFQRMLQISTLLSTADFFSSSFFCRINFEF